LKAQIAFSSLLLIRVNNFKFKCLTSKEQEEWPETRNPQSGERPSSGQDSLKTKLMKSERPSTCSTQTEQELSIPAN
jgi:hypothetical protein